MASQDSQRGLSSKVFVKSRPSEPLEIGPTEYREEITNLAIGIVSRIKQTIQPRSRSRPGNTKTVLSAKGTESVSPKWQNEAQTRSKSANQVDEHSQLEYFGRPLSDNGSEKTPSEADIRSAAQELVSDIKYTINPTAKPPVQSPFKLSDRLELLARPKKGILYQDGFICPAGAIPETYLPSWKLLPLHNKIPADRFPYEISMAKVPEEIFSVPESVKTINLESPTGDFFPSFMDPGHQSYLKKKGVQQHLLESGQITKSGRIVCSLKELNDYRRYLAKLQARATRMRLKAEYEEEKRIKEEMRVEKAAKRDEERQKRNTEAALREQIKDIVEGAKQSVMAIEEQNVNSNSLQALFKQLALERQAIYRKTQNRKLFESEKEKKRKELMREKSKKDKQRYEKLLNRKEEFKSSRQRKLKEFWDRKAACQSVWMEEGFQLERKWAQEREENVRARKALMGLTLEEKLMNLTISPMAATSSSGTCSSTSSRRTYTVTSKMKTPKETPTPKEKTLDEMLQQKFQSKASEEPMKGNPSREEILTPVSSKEITLEDILKREK